MQTKREILKTLGPQAARLITELYARSQPIFRLRDVSDITGLADGSTRSFVRKLVNRGIVTRIKAGLYVLVPFEMGHHREYLGCPLVVARELMDGSDYYLSHSTAMEIHGMTTQPQMIVTVTTPKVMRPFSTQGVQFRFCTCSHRHLFGVTEYWATKQEKVRVSDPARTIIDGLRQPEHCGGLTEVAKGLCMRRQDIDVELLVEYGMRVGVGAVIRRLGFLLEMYEMATPLQVSRLRSSLTSTYVRLDPVLPAEGKYLHRWRVQVNVEPEEFLAVVGT